MMFLVHDLEIWHECLGPKLAQPMETEMLDIEKPWFSAFRQNGGEKLDRTLTVRDRRSVDVIYFDFAKAFDSVSHPKLVHKLQAYGICGNLLDILTDFLFDRSHSESFYQMLLPRFFQ